MLENPSQKEIDFAVIGHQDSWSNIASFINGMRSDSVDPLPIEKIKNTFGYIPPRGVFRMRVKSKTGAIINGIYIETFIEPDKLGVSYLRSNIKKVNDAIKVAQNLNAKIIALGGFTSIVLEGSFRDFDTTLTKITTGNTLTCAYITKSIEKAANKFDIDLKESSMLIIGATGDIGMACTSYFNKKVKKLLLCARNKRRLEIFSNKIALHGNKVEFNTDVTKLAIQADFIISVASSNNIEIEAFKPQVIICDAGYPKNLELKINSTTSKTRLYHGGMGQVGYGFDFNPDYQKYFYEYPSPHIGHGCILEAVVLAFENKFENYSHGKGNITSRNIEDIYALSLKHGLKIAPFYNAKGLWN